MISTRLLSLGLCLSMALCASPVSAGEPIQLKKVEASCGQPVKVSYKSKLPVCVHLLNASTKQPLHTQNIFCDRQESVSTTNMSAAVVPGLKVILCDGNNYYNCSKVVVVKGNACK